MAVRFFHDTWNVCWREMKFWIRSRSALFSSLVQPIAWLLFVGNIFQLPTNIMEGYFGTPTYLQFFTPTVIVMVAVLGGIIGGYSIITDLQKGYFRKMLVAPIARGAIAAGKALSFSLKVAFQAIIICVIALVMGVTVATGFLGMIVVILTAMLLSFAFGGLSLAIAVSAKNIEAHQAILNMLALPLVFLSTSISSFQSMPQWFAVIARFNPVTYAIEPIRAIMTTGWDMTVVLPGLLIVGVFTVAMLLLATVLIRRWRI